MKIEAIFFDVNGTLRTRQPDLESQRASFEFISNRLGFYQGDGQRWQTLEKNYKGYAAWTKSNLLHLSETEIWSKWMCPDLDPALIEPYAPELMLAWVERKGICTPLPQAEETIKTIRDRGYHLGLISNTVSTLDIPRFLKTWGWTEYFEVVVLSADFKYKKPAPDPFLRAAQSVHVDPTQCAFVGNRVSKDILGCKRAGFALGVIIQDLRESTKEDLGSFPQPDLVIDSIKNLLDLFPPKSNLT